MVNGYKSATEAVCRDRLPVRGVGLMMDVSEHRQGGNGLTRARLGNVIFP